ncbi:MAG: hypothetical protein IKB43_06755 [Fibrobacter sp.]|nr:hypothetical protein [Fibrobacter sp.]
MLFKKILLSSALISMAGFVACGDDSSSNSGSGELPKSVPTFFDLADVECNADRKCETIIVEEGPDTYECDGVSQWNMLINSMPSKVCPAKEEEKGAEDDEEGKTEGDDNKAPESSASETTSTDSGAESTDSGATSTDSGAASTDSNTESANSGAESTDSGAGEMVSCNGIEGIPGTPSCLEVPVSDTEKANAMKEQCASVLGGTLGTGCPADAIN